MAVEQESYEFKNSDTCWGSGTKYIDGDTTYAIDTITISDGQYPENGTWARNLEAEESVRVLSGRGGVAIRGGTYQELDASAPEDSPKQTAKVPAREWFRWGSKPGEDLVIEMRTDPAFNIDLYETATEEEIVKRESEQ